MSQPFHSGPCKLRRTDEIEAVLALYPSNKPHEIAKKLGVNLPRVKQIVWQYGPLSFEPPIKAPVFDGWCFVDDNVETGRL